VTPIRQQAARLRERYRGDSGRPVQAYASAPSALPGGTMEFRVSCPARNACSVAVRRFGTAVATPAVRFAGESQGPARHDNGLTWCDWEPSLLLDIPESWPPGLYVARFSVDAPLLSVVALRGRSAYVPFVVRAAWDVAFPTLVVLPFAAYSLRNRWPVAGTELAPAASLDRPFAGNGLPAGFEADAEFAERHASVADFATSLDLHTGAVDPARYDRVLVRDDAWSAPMRDALAKADVAVGPEPAVRFEAAPDGRADRVLVRL